MSLGLAILDEVAAGHGRLILLAGEPGIGKSRMADELAATARRRGFEVAWGRCWEAGGAPPYWPWTQSLRVISPTLDGGHLTTLGVAAGDIAQLLPELGGGVEAAETTPSDPDAARFRLFESATRLLRHRASQRPLMLVLDDLQVADTPSLLLLRFVVAALGDDPILLVATYRDSEMNAGHRLTETLTELSRDQSVRHITLRGLDETEVAEYIGAAAGRPGQQRLAHAVHDETEGNPLFVEEVVRLLADEGRLIDEDRPASPLGMPHTVREVIRRRLAPLSERAHDLLIVASVLGREFNLDALAHLAELTADDVLDALEEPRSARVVIDVPGTRLRLRFSHVLIRECLYDSIPRRRRMQLHGQAAQVLEHVYRGDLNAHLAELAHHHFEAAPAAGVDTAIAYARSAGEQAVSRLAYEEAVRLYRMALQALEMGSTPDPGLRCDILLALGDAQGRAGDEEQWKRSFGEAADLARALARPEALARAALGYGGRRVWVRAGGDPRVVQLLQAGLEAIGPQDGRMRARLLARLAGALRDDPAPEPRESLAREAVEVARRLADPGTLAYALEGLWAARWNADTTLERLSIADELLAAGEEAGDLERVVAGRQNRLLVQFELGDIAAAYRELTTSDRIAGEVQQPSLAWLPADARVSLALVEGRFDEAERQATILLPLRGRSNRSDAVTHYTLHMFQLRREQGRLAEVEELVRQSADEFPWYPMLRCALCCLCAELGHLTQARVELGRLADHDAAGIPFDNHWLLSMALLSDAVQLLDDPDRADALYRRLLPYATLTCLAAGGDSRTASMAGPLGRLAATMSRIEDAAAHLEDALQRNLAMGARPAAAHTRYELAGVLMGRDRPGDRQAATALLEAAAATCDAVGMPALRARIDALLGSLGVATPTTPESAGPGREEASVRAQADDCALTLEGEYWTIGYEGRVLRLRDSKGMRVLARLLSDPGRPHACVDLERLGAPEETAVIRALASSDAGELIDDEARRAYRARLDELRDAIAEAEAEGSADQAAAMAEELQFITRELSRALGLGGRARRAGSIAERARLNVTRAVKTSLRRIAQTDADLGAHLDATVHTGTICVYTPDPRAAVAWRVTTDGGPRARPAAG